MVIELCSLITHFDDGLSRDPPTERSGRRNDRIKKVESRNLSANLMSQQGVVRESRAAPTARGERGERGAGRRKTEVGNGKEIAGDTERGMKICKRRRVRRDGDTENGGDR